MPTQKQITVYSFEELSPEARQRALDDARQSVSETWDGDATIDDAKRVFAFLGIAIDRVYYSGFWSQGDGACFEGTFDARKVDAAGLVAYAPQDAELHRLARVFAEIAQANPEASFRVRHSGHYSHRFCTRFDVENVADEQTEARLIEAARDGMQWIYRQLQKEYEYATAPEQVADFIRANEYEYRENGEIFR